MKRERNHAILAAVACSVLFGASSAAATAEAHDIPRLDGVRIDGDDADWSEAAFHVGVLGRNRVAHEAPGDLAVQLRLGWNAEGLLMLIEAVDDEARESASKKQLYTHDSVELFLAEAVGGDELVQCVLAPGRDPAYPELRQHPFDLRADEALRETPPNFAAAGVPREGGYAIEVLVPWSNVGVEPALGLEVGVQVLVNDVDGSDEHVRARWHPRGQPHHDRTALVPVRLAEQAAPSVSALAFCDPRYLTRYMVEVRAVPGLAGEPIRIKAGQRVVAEGVLAAQPGRAKVRLPVPWPDEGVWPSLDVLVGERVVTTFDLPDPAALRARAVMEMQPVFASSVFQGEGFPTCDFENPAWADLLLGAYEIGITYYDADYQPVTRAEHPGRYGAVIQIETEDGRHYTRHATLYRQPEEVRFWWKEPMDFGMDALPAAFGVDARVAEGQRRQLNDFVKSSWYMRVGQDSSPAVLLAGLSETDSDAAVANQLNDVWARNAAWWCGLTRRINGNAERFDTPLARPASLGGESAPTLRMGTPQEAGMDPAVIDALRSLIDEWDTDPERVAFNICIARQGVVFFTDARGEIHGQPVTGDTAFGIASLTKTLHGLVVMMFADQGLLKLDETIDHYLPEFEGVATAQPATLRHLMTHTADLQTDLWGDHMTDLAHRVAEIYPYVQVGKAHHYNSTSLELASRVCEQISGKPMAYLYRDHLFGPLGLTHTHANDASGGCQATAEELAVVGQMMLNGGAYGDLRFLQPESLAEMRAKSLAPLLNEPTEQEWGIGLMPVTMAGLSEHTMNHGSWSNSRMYVDPEQDLVIAIARHAPGADMPRYEPRLVETIVRHIVDAP